MLKCILFLLSGYYYGLMEGRRADLQGKIRESAPWMEILFWRAAEGAGAEERPETENPLVMGNCREGSGGLPTGQMPAQETLVITDLPETARKYQEDGWYVAALYQEKNQGAEFPEVRYGIEDVFALEYRSYEEVYRRLAGLPWDILETKRLMVRESTLEDVEEFYRIYQEPSITRYMENLFPQKEAERAYIKAYIDQIYGFYGFGLWTVVLKENGRVIGRAGLSVREGYEYPELGFVVEAAYQRQGYGREVCEAILKYAREELSFGKVQAFVKEGNLASKRLLSRLGFLCQGKVFVKDGEYELYMASL